MLYRNGRKVDSEDESMDDEDSGSGGLISKSLLPEGAKVGDTVKFKISHLFDDEAEIKYQHSDESDPEDESQKAPEAPASEDAFEEISADA